MTRPGTRKCRRRAPVIVMAAAMGLAFGAVADGGTPRRVRVPSPYVPTSLSVARATGSAPTPMLGSFYGTPYMTVRGNFPAGGGYSPLGQYGDSTLALYGPLSPLRATIAPVRVYGRGYDGRPIVTDGTGFSTPNLPEISPVVYPSRANSAYYGFRRSASPAQWDNAINWIDQN